MQHNRFFILVVLLVFSTSFNLARCLGGQHFEFAREAQKLKINDRRSAGLVPYPRIGRNSEMATLPRSERALGMIHQPRIGRSDVSNIDQVHDLSFDNIEYDMDNLLGEEYPNRHSIHFEKKDDSLFVDRGHGYKDLRFSPKSDYVRSFSALRDSQNTQGQGGSYTPRLGRENEHDIASFP